MNNADPNRRMLELSARGRARRDRMLDDLQLEMTRLHKRRNIRKWVSATAIVMIATVGVWQLPAWNPSRPDSMAAFRGSQPVEPSASHGSTNCIVVRNQPDVLDRFLVTDSSLESGLELEIISDNELLGLMNEAGKPSVLGRIDGELVVIPCKSL